MNTYKPFDRLTTRLYLTDVKDQDSIKLLTELEDQLPVTLDGRYNKIDLDRAYLKTPTSLAFKPKA